MNSDLPLTPSDTQKKAAHALVQLLDRLAKDQLISMNYLTALFRLYDEDDLAIGQIFDQHGGHRRRLMYRLEGRRWIKSTYGPSPDSEHKATRYRLTATTRTALFNVACRICPGWYDNSGLSLWLRDVQELGNLSFMRLMILARLTEQPGQHQGDLVRYKSGYRRDQMDTLIEDGLIEEIYPDETATRGMRYYVTQKWIDHLERFLDPEEGLAET